MLYVIIVYAFNNQIRFNSNGEFNLPVGKRDFNKKMQQKLSDFIDKIKEQNCKFTCLDFREFDIDILKSDDNITLKPTKVYIGFNRGRKSVVSIKVQKRSLVLWLNTEPNTLNDPKKIIKDVTHIGHHGNGNSQINISNAADIGYIEDLLKRFVCNIM